MKVLLTFLGTGNYEKCNYYFENPENIVKGVKYIQEALIELFLRDNNDFITYIFITDEAKKENWDNNLEKILLSKYGDDRIKAIKIPSIIKEENIWEIFEIVYNCIPDNSEIIIDITHAFRSIPMLAVVLINYARVLKNIKVQGIYYGAIEVLGRPFEIKKIPEEKRNAPIINLASFLKLMDWTEASFEFNKYGITEKLKNLILQEINPRLKETKGKDEIAQRLKSVATELDDFTKNITTVRGKKLLYKINYENIKNSLEYLKQTVPIKPLKPLIDISYSKIKDFKNSDTLNFIPSAEFCIKHNLIQQAITILLEGVITFFCERFGIDYSVEDNRNLISQILKIKSKNIPEDKWKPPANKDIEFTKNILNKVDFEFAKIFANLQDMRNDINHGGFKKNARIVNTFDQIKDYLEKIKKSIKEF